MIRTSSLTAKAAKIRESEHRLKPSLRLKTRSDIVEFIHDKGIVSVLGGNELPSLISAILGHTWSPSGKGFSGWNEWWDLKIEGQQLSRLLGEVERRDDILASRIFRRSKTILAFELWPVFAPIIGRQRDIMMQGESESLLESKLLKTIESAGSIRTDHLRRQLDLEGKENNYKFHKSLLRLESLGLIVGAEDPEPETHLHANIWQTWERRTRNNAKSREVTYEEAVPKLIRATVEASVIVRENDVREWYPIGSDIQEFLNPLVSKGEVKRVDGYLVSPLAKSV